MEPTQEQELIKTLRDWFSYDPETGIITRKKKTRSDAHDTINYRHAIYFQNKYYNYARLCWMLYYGKVPTNWVDHKDRVKAHNWITNLRDATPTQNQHNKAGYGTYAKGVTWRNRKEKPFQAKIRVNGERIHLGSFATEAEAAEAYRQAAVKYHGEFACLK